MLCRAELENLSHVRGSSDFLMAPTRETTLILEEAPGISGWDEEPRLNFFQGGSRMFG